MRLLPAGCQVIAWHFVLSTSNLGHCMGSHGGAIDSLAWWQHLSSYHMSLCASVWRASCGVFGRLRPHFGISYIERWYWSLEKKLCFQGERKALFYSCSASHISPAFWIRRLIRRNKFSLRWSSKARHNLSFSFWSVTSIEICINSRQLQVRANFSIKIP